MTDNTASNQSNCSIGRLHYLDALRGIAAISVVWYHFILESHADRAMDLGPYFHAVITVLVNELDLGKFGVVLFFTISGFIIPNSLHWKAARPAKRFLISRFFRLYPLYWLATLVCIPLLDVAHQPSLRTFLLNVTMIQGFLGAASINGAAWTLQIELVFYALCLMLFLRDHLQSARMLFIAFFANLTFALCLALLRFWLVRKLPVVLPLGIAVMFIGSLWRAMLTTQSPAAKTYAIWAIILFFCVIPLICVFGYSRDFGYGETPQSYLLCYSTALLVFLGCTTKFRLRSRWLMQLGTISYSVYLLHPPIMLAAERLGLFTTTADTPLTRWVQLFLLVAFVLGMSHISYLCIEKPMVSCGRSLSSRWQKTRVEQSVRSCGRNPSHAELVESQAVLDVIHREPVCMGAGDADGGDRGKVGSGGGCFSPSPVLARGAGS